MSPLCDCNPDGSDVTIRPREQYEARAKIAKALAHPSRLLILDALSERDMCVCELTKLTGKDQSTTSKHLGVLRQAGMVNHHREGLLTFYHLNITCLQQLWGAIECVLKKNFADEKAGIGE